MADLNTLYTQLAGLSADELKAVKRHVVLLAADAPGHQQSNGNDVPDSDETLVLDVICRVLKRRGIGPVHVAQLRNSRHYSAFRDKQAGLAEFLGRADKRRLVQAGVLTLGLDLLCDTLVEQHIPVSGPMLMAHIHRLPEVLDRHFPGYAQAGMLSWIVRRGNDYGQGRQQV